MGQTRTSGVGLHLLELWIQMSSLGTGTECLLTLPLLREGEGVMFLMLCYLCLGTCLSISTTHL